MCVHCGSDPQHFPSSLCLVQNTPKPAKTKYIWILFLQFLIQFCFRNFWFTINNWLMVMRPSMSASITSQTCWSKCSSNLMPWCKLNTLCKSCTFKFNALVSEGILLIDFVTLVKPCFKNVSLNVSILHAGLYNWVAQRTCPMVTWDFLVISRRS